MQRDELPDPGERVAAYLRAHPHFLATHAGLYDVLLPPRRIHGPGLADHMEAMLHQARARADAAQRAGATAAADRRAAEGFARRVHEAVLALMRGHDPADLAAVLRVDAVRLCSEATPGPRGAIHIPHGTVAAALAHRPALVRPTSSAATLHGEAAALAMHEALVHIPYPPGPTILALACRDAAALAGATTDALVFLGQALATTLHPA